MVKHKTLPGDEIKEKNIKNKKGWPTISLYDHISLASFSIQMSVYDSLISQTKQRLLNKLYLIKSSKSIIFLSYVNKCNRILSVNCLQKPCW